MRKWYRSSRDRKLFGVCGGLAELIGVDSTLLRMVVAVATVFSGGTVFLLYLAAAFIIPKESHAGHDLVPPYYGSPKMGGPSPYHAGGFRDSAVPPYTPPSASSAAVDEMMRDIEKKAMYKELEQLRAKVAQYEKGE